MRKSFFFRRYCLSLFLLHQVTASDCIVLCTLEYYRNKKPAIPEHAGAHTISHYGNTSSVSYKPDITRRPGSGVSFNLHRLTRHGFGGDQVV